MANATATMAADRCQELTGIPADDPDWSQKFQERNQREQCRLYVQFAVQRWLELGLH